MIMVCKARLLLQVPEDMAMDIIPSPYSLCRQGADAISGNCRRDLVKESLTEQRKAVKVSIFFRYLLSRIVLRLKRCYNVLVD